MFGGLFSDVPVLSWVLVGTSALCSRVLELELLVCVGRSSLALGAEVSGLLDLNCTVPEGQTLLLGFLLEPEHQRSCPTARR